MKVLVVGGGPGGLYAALLIKKAHPDWDVGVAEKNPPGATYGWGVVFSDRTLTSFREADYHTYAEITERFVMWDAIDVRFGDEVVRCGGQPFAGIARVELLGLLQRRCAELGVGLEFETEIDPSEAAAVDLLVAADGVHSDFRRTRADELRPTIEEGAARYIWFGTDRPLDSFTFIFRNHDDGFFQAHSYPFDGTMSTFIVECHEQTWRRAGLDVAGEEESIAYCEKLFAPELASHSLESNNSKWITFLTVRNRRWRSGNVVLLGDAAHTAHFSIGSGTKLAMEDAIALANALDLHKEIAPALADYELERRPRVERFQEAARQSQAYFEATARFRHLDPLQFAFHLLTRSGRIDYDELRLRDRVFVSRVDSWFANNSQPAAMSPPPAFVSAELRGLSVANRIVVGARPVGAAIEGVPGPQHAASLREAAATGAGLVVTEPVAVSAHGRISAACPGLWTAEQSEAWHTIVEELHNAGARAAVRLGHSGARGSTEPRIRGADRPVGGWNLPAASAVPYTRRSATPIAMDDGAMADVMEDFVTAAAHGRAAEFDALVLDMSRGYLLASFLSPLTNRRTDGYGGSIENRARYPVEVLSAVRSAWRGVLIVSLTADDWARRGATVTDAVETARLLKGAGCDAIEVRAGQTVAATKPRYDPYYLASYSDRIRNEVRIETIATGPVSTTDDANTLLAAGRADFCMLLRP